MSQTTASKLGVNVDDTAMPIAAMTMVTGTYFLFALLDTTGKYLSTLGFHPFFIVWVRFLVHGLILAAVLKVWSNKAAWVMNRPFLHAIRAFLLPMTTLCNFAALQYLQLDQTMTVFLATPMVVTALAGPMLGEWAGPRRWAAVFVGFIGVLVVARPGTAMFSPPIMFSLGATFTYALYTLLTRKLANSETQESLNFYPTIFGSLILLPLALSQWKLPSVPFEGVLLLAAGVFGLGGHILLIKASKLTSASKIAPFIYVQLLWMVGLGWLVFGDVPDMWTMFGALIICSSGFYLMQREHFLRKQSLLKPMVK